MNHRQPDLTVVLEDVEDPHNIAAVMRTCDSVGVQELYVINTKKIPYTYFGKRSSSSAARWVTVRQFDTITACMEEVKGRYSNVFATHLGETASSLYELDLTEPVALVFGNERTGVSAECLSYCNGNFIIPQVGMIQSLNISVACAVTLYEAFRQRLAKGMFNDTARLPGEQLEQLSGQWGITKSQRKRRNRGLDKE